MFCPLSDVIFICQLYLKKTEKKNKTKTGTGRKDTSFERVISLRERERMDSGDFNS